MLTIEDISLIIQKSKDLDIQELRLTGGEPLLHPLINDICRLIKREGLRVSLNTNLVAFNRLKPLIFDNLIDEIVVGLDFYKGTVSKDSINGLSSRTILRRIVSVKRYVPEVSIATVYNGDINNIENILRFCIHNECRLKVLEPQSTRENPIDQTYSFDELISSLASSFQLTYRQDEREETNGYYNNIKVISFFPSLCRLQRCDICKSTQLRISSEGYVKPCINDTTLDFSIHDGCFLDKIHAL